MDQIFNIFISTIKVIFKKCILDGDDAQMNNYFCVETPISHHISLLTRFWPDDLKRIYLGSYHSTFVTSTNFLDLCQCWNQQWWHQELPSASGGWNICARIRLPCYLCYCWSQDALDLPVDCSMLEGTGFWKTCSFPAEPTFRLLVLGHQSFSFFPPVTCL